MTSTVGNQMLNFRHDFLMGVAAVLLCASAPSGQALAEIGEQASGDMGTSSGQVTTIETADREGSPTSFASPTAASRVVFVQQPKDAKAGAIIVPPITVRLRDASGRNVEELGVPISLSISSGTGNLSGTTTQATNNIGVATFDDLSIDLIGAKKLTATSAGLEPAVSKSFDIKLGPPARLQIQVEPSETATAGLPFLQQPEVWVVDAGGNPVTGDNSTIVTASRLAGSGTLQGTVVATARRGVASFVNLSHNVAGGITLLFTGGELIQDTSRVILVNSADPARLVFVQQPTNTMAGAAITPPVTVRLRDAYGNDVNTSGTMVTIALTSGNGELHGTLTAGTISGIASFGDLSIDRTGPKRLTASSGNLTAAVSDVFTISAGTETSLAFVQQPSDAEATSPIAPPVTVQLLDSFGNEVPVAGVNITLELSSGSGTLSGTTTKATDGTGLATFTDLSIDLSGQKILRATSGSLIPDLSSMFSIAAGQESQLAFVQQPTNTIAGQIISPAVTVQIRDSLGNDVARAGVSILIELSPGSTGTLSGTSTQLTDASGLATFSNLSVELAGTKSLTATASGLDHSESDPYVVGPAPPSRLVFEQNPSNSIAGVPFPTQPVVALQDQYKNLVTGVAQEITIAIQTDAGWGGVLSGATTVSIETLTGRASFSDLSIDKSGTGYTLTATGSSVSTTPGAVICSPFSIAAASPTQVRVETAAGGNGTLLGTQNVSSGTSITVYAIARDDFDNFVSNAAGASWALLNRTGGVAESDLLPSADGRSATFSGAAVGSAVINASVTGLLSVPSGTLTVVNNAIATKIFVETAANGAGSPVQDQDLPSGESLLVYAIARDLNNNFVANVAADAWSLVESTGGITTGDLLTTADQQSAVLTARLAGTTRIQAILRGLTSTPTGIISVTFGPASVVTPVGGTPQSTKVGTPFETRLAAAVTDAAGNSAVGVVVTFDAPSVGASGSFVAGANTVVTDTAGIGLAPVFTANSVAGTYVVTASVNGAPESATFTLTNSPSAVGDITGVEGTPQSVPVGTVFPTRLAASIQDSFGNPVNGADITFTAPTTGASGTFPGGVLSAVATTDESGIGTAPDFTANSTAGTFTVTAKASGLAGDALFFLTNTAGPAASIASNGGIGQSTVVNTPFSEQLRVVVKDASGNVVRGAPVTFVAPGEGPSGVFPGGRTINVATDTNGAAIAPSLSANTLAGTFTVEAYAQGIATPARFELTNLPAQVNAFLIEAGGGGAIGTQVVQVPFKIHITAHDEFANVATTFTGTADLSSSGGLTQGGGSTPPFVEGVLAELTVAVQNAGPAVLFALRTGGAESGQSHSFQVNNPIPEVTSISPSHGARGESLSLRISGSGFLQGVTSVVLGNNITTYETVASDSQITVALNIGSGAFEGPRTVLVINSPPGGGIANVDSGFVVEGIIYPTTYTLLNTIVFPSHQQNSEFQASDYRIVGLPGAPGVPISQFLSGSKDQDWVAYWDNGASSEYLVSFDGTSTFACSPGRAFWLLHRGPLVINTTVPTAPLDSSTSVAIPLHAGWNLIANPFTFPVAWADVESANQPSVLGGVYTFEGSFAMPDILSPYQGCLYDNVGNSASLVIPFKEVGLFKQAVPDEGSWRIELELTVGEYVERLVSFGVSPGAKKGRDDFDFRHPRGVDLLPEAYFNHPEWGMDGGAFASDMRPVIGELETWHMDVRAKPQHAVQLSFAGVSSVPDEYGVVLFDDDHSLSVDLRADPVYRFTAATPVSHFRIAVGLEDAVRGLVEEAVPKEFALENNFPNPFNPSTTIPVRLPWNSTVGLRVYSILGDMVRTLYVGPLARGRHLFDWDGTSDQGRPVSTGVYLVQLTTDGGQRFIGKMLLMR